MTATPLIGSQIASTGREDCSALTVMTTASTGSRWSSRDPASQLASRNWRLVTCGGTQKQSR